MNIEKVFAHNKQWVKDQLEHDKDFFKKLSKGQKPKFLYIGCSDSRVGAADLLGAKPGEVFVHRNIANLVVNIDMNIMSVLVYAIEHLKVEHIVVAGHYDCGGIKAAMEPGDLGFLNPWLRNVRNVYRTHIKELDAIKNVKKRYDRLVELNVLEQCINITKTVAFQRARKNRGLQLHGWVFNLKNGQLVDLKIDIDKEIADLKKIYNLMND